MSKRGLSGLRQLVRTTSVESKECQQKVKEKREKRRQRNSQERENEGVPNFQLGSEKTIDRIKTTADKDNWFAVQMWFYEAISRNNEQWLPENHDIEDKRIKKNQTWWTWKEKNPAERMLKLYGSELTKQAIFWLCDNWKVMLERSDGKLIGAPNINFLWGAREMIMPDVKEGKKLIRKRKKKHMVGEYNEDRAKEAPKVGWGDNE